MGGLHAKTAHTHDELRQPLANGGTYEQSSEKQSLLPALPGCGARHVLVLWAFLGFANIFILRVDMSIALVAMATQNASSAHGGGAGRGPPLSNDSLSPSDVCHNETAVTHGDPLVTEEFNWSNSLQGFILSAFYYGYFLTQIAGGVVARRHGGKTMFTVAMAGCSALSLLTPLAARTHVAFLIAIRVVQGSLQGVVFPSMQVVLSHWAPANERSRLLAFCYAGCQAGTVLGMLSAGYLCYSAWGWPSVFYIEGTLGLVWCIGWAFFAFDTPADHPRISGIEKTYIESSTERSHKAAPRTPWCSILSSPAVYAVAAAHFANDWGCFAVMTCFPKFMKDVLRYDIAQNGLLTSLPYLLTWVCNMAAGSIADSLSKRLRIVTVRKLMVCIGLLGPASLLLGAAYLPGCGRGPVVTLITLAMGFSGFTVAGHSVNHLDNAPAFAGIMFGITNTFGTTSGFVGPAVAGALTDRNDTRHSWQIFFLISGAVYLLGGLVFVLLARAELQPWATVKDAEGVDRVVSPPCPRPLRPTYGSCSLQNGDDEEVIVGDDDEGDEGSRRGEEGDGPERKGDDGSREEGNNNESETGGRESVEERARHEGTGVPSCDPWRQNVDGLYISCANSESVREDTKVCRRSPSVSVSSIHE